MNQYHLDRLRLGWRTEPFPHTVAERLFDPALVAECAAEARAIPPEAWHRFRNELEVKDAAPFASGGPALARMRAELEALAPTLEALCGIPGLQYAPDGGGVHSIPPGGYRGVHRDFNRSSTGLWRRVNVLVYLQQHWQDTWGGHLQLEYRDGDGVAAATPPVYVRPDAGRTVVFVCGPHSWHGHPYPHRAPVPRLSVAAYYFTVEPPEGVEVPAHSTVFV
jgi:hypothetical protein